VLLFLLMFPACRDPTLGPERLRVYGRVTDAASGQPIAAVRARVQFINPDGGSWEQVLGSDSTDARGDYVIMAGAAPGYAAPNCTVMGLALQAEGYRDSQVYFLFEPGCELRIAELHVDAMMYADDSAGAVRDD
jgi:hypothetical protein